MFFKKSFSSCAENRSMNKEMLDLLCGKDGEVLTGEMDSLPCG